MLKEALSSHLHFTVSPSHKLVGRDSTVIRLVRKHCS